MWIEILLPTSSVCNYIVTPLAGVWIEIYCRLDLLVPTESLPLRECGLKLASGGCCGWLAASLPLRECGLKYLLWHPSLIYPPSLPLRECGLKFSPLHGYSVGLHVTPLAGVWIEIPCNTESGSDAKSLPLRECGLKC